MSDDDNVLTLEEFKKLFEQAKKELGKPLTPPPIVITDQIIDVLIETGEMALLPQNAVVSPRSKKKIDAWLKEAE